jgi:hypothetical protein
VILESEGEVMVGSVLGLRRKEKGFASAATSAERMCLAGDVSEEKGTWESAEKIF